MTYQSAARDGSSNPASRARTPDRTYALACSPAHVRARRAAPLCFGRSCWSFQITTFGEPGRCPQGQCLMTRNRRFNIRVNPLQESVCKIVKTIAWIFLFSLRYCRDSAQDEAGGEFGQNSRDQSTVLTRPGGKGPVA